ncbi:hypothetical protein E2493_12380 [Sphingomonas parva]|uniref:Uncharacterized protein n=1 Tax=Sphingomonas parva TaxID=2555898 RepID=A0A4Y8ZU52_9SPHN|nr:hypothetical protein [Sphingomonas parva]TFI57986.1 hypothetical protein E2493_12380 [Sphingomonas parva]
MRDDRFKIAVDEDYVAALGLAVYAFATLEWRAIQCCERIAPGSVDALEDRTAGRVADTLRRLVSEALEPSPEQQALEQAARDFQAFTRTRNNLVHAKPGKAADGAQRLFRDGDQWTIAEMETVADAFTACALRLEAFLEGVLAGSPRQDRGRS